MNENLNQSQNQNQTFPKLLITVLIILVVIAGGYFAYAKYQNLWPWQRSAPSPVVSAPDETANWKTYRNEKYGFEVKYPSGHEPSNVLMNPEANIDEVYFKDYLTIRIGEGGFSYLDEARKAWEKSFGKTNDYFINGGRGFRHGAYANNLGGVILSNGKLRFSIERAEGDNVTDIQLSLFISTFKFTK